MDLEVSPGLCLDQEVKPKVKPKPSSKSPAPGKMSCQRGPNPLANFGCRILSKNPGGPLKDFHQNTFPSFLSSQFFLRKLGWPNQDGWKQLNMRETINIPLTIN